MRGLPSVVAGFFTFFAFALAFPQPPKIYGVNIGSWLVSEPWMFPEEWVSMGGQMCGSDCSGCIQSEFALTKANPSAADQTFDKHWQSWFTQADVQNLQKLGINTVRIPLGYWLVEPLVENGEYYPKGGMRRLKEGLQWLKQAGIAVLLDHHALPGVAAENQMFAGQCTSNIQFYTQKNYHRALIWTAVMTFFSHVDPDFGNVFAMEAVNEPLMDASRTPNFGEFQKNFVQTIRAVEDILNNNPASDDACKNITTVLYQAGKVGDYSDEVKSVLIDSVPVLLQMISKYGSPDMTGAVFSSVKDPLTTTFMDTNWQYNNAPNPADAKDGPQTYDDHLYYNFGGVADANPSAYMNSICNLKRTENDANNRNSPMWFGEWAITTNFDTTDDFLKQWADAQKFMYSKSAGWFFWNFKIEDSPSTQGFEKHWSYFKAVEQGYLTEDPAAYHDPNVCAPYIKG